MPGRSLLVNAMAKTLSDHLLYSLEELVPYDFEKFKFKLQNISPEKEQPRIPSSQLQRARPVRMAYLLRTYYGEPGAVQLTLQVLRGMNQNQLAEELHRATSPENFIQEKDAGSSSGESMPRGLRMPEVLQGAGQLQSGERPAGQPETSGRASQKKPVNKHRDQKGPEVLCKPETKKLNVGTKRVLLPNKVQDKSTGLRRNASSAGRLQGLFNSGVTRREHNVSSGKERPRSLEITISSSERELPNQGTLLTQEKVPHLAGRLAQAGCPLYCAQERGPAGGACLPGSHSWPSMAPRDPKASNPAGCQAALPTKNSGCCEWQEGQPVASLSPRALPQCKRHLRQVQLLFCEDDEQPICLICKLSEEHRDHRVRPLEEAALDYKEQIQKQVKHLKELRCSVEEQRSHGHTTTEELLKQVAAQKQRVQRQLQELCQFLEQQEQLFVTWLEDLGDAISQAGETYGTRVSGDIASLDELIWDLEARQCQSMWTLMQDIGVTLHRAKTMTISEPWTTSQDTEKKIQLLCQKSESVEKNMKRFSETLRSEIETFSVPDLMGAQAHAVQVTLDVETAHPNLAISEDRKSVRLGNKDNRLPDSPERFESCMVTLGCPSFFSGRHYWEVEVGDKTGWILGVCKSNVNRKGSMTLSPEKGYWVLMMTRRNEYQVSTFPPTHLYIREPPRCVGIFLDYKGGGISFYNVTTKSHIYTFTGFASSEPLRSMFSPGTHDGGKNVEPLTICPVGGQGP